MEKEMSAILFLTSGGMASTGGDLDEAEKTKANDIVVKFGKAVRAQGMALQVPASLLKVIQCTFLLVAKDTANLHFVFADAPNGNQLNYRNMASQGRLDLQTIAHQVRVQVGDVAWAFSSPLNLPNEALSTHINAIAHEYVDSVLQSQKKPGKSISEEAISNPEIASGLEKFRLDHPVEKKTAFIIMQVGSTAPHKAIVSCIKDTLKTFGIVALRADDKEYMDDLFPNIKTYMHACDFGVAVFDRITEDDFNPNVSLEVGYMLGMGKNVLLLKDKTLKSLQTDLTGKLYKPFDTSDIANSMPEQIRKWLADKGLV
jgi:hypothetical protein